MATHLNIQLEHPVITWKNFCRTSPAFSIALDGYVSAGPCFDPTGPRINFNHHEDVDRLATRSTCAQVLIAIRQGLFNRFQDQSGPQAHVFVNDCDEDVCLSWFLINNFALVEKDCPERITRLVTMEDLMDATAGAYPLPIGLSSIKELAWIFEPYRTFRITGGLDRKVAAEYRAIIAAVGQRIDRYLKGAGEYAPIDTSYKRIGGGDTWAMIEETGSHARTGAYADGIRAYVAVRAISPQRWAYTVGRMSAFVPFDVGRIMTALNAVEGDKKDKWGGANTIGGSPRTGGSKLSPAQVESIINQVLQGQTNTSRPKPRRRA